MKTYVLYNHKSNNGAGLQGAEKVKEHWKDRDLEFVDVITFEGYDAFFKRIAPDDEVCLCGGDGTLNHFVNDADCDNIKNKVFYFPTGSGNDFWNDLEKKPGDAPAQINKYITDLPTVTVGQDEQVHQRRRLRHRRLLLRGGRQAEGEVRQANQLHLDRHQGSALPLQAHQRRG